MMRRRFLVAAAAALAGAAAGQETDRHAALERAYSELVASRLAPEYWERQKRLEEDVALAHERLDKALARWNELR